MKAFAIAVCLLLAGSALGQADAKLKAIRSANQAADSANALASGVHKREAGTGGDDSGGIAKEAKPKPTPEDK